MDAAQLQQILSDLITHWESETVEFKEAGNDYATDRIGRYFSALANEANLEGAESAWLVFGVNNKTRSVVGSDYREDSERLHSLKQQIAQDSEPRISFRGIHELSTPEGRVVLFEIPASPQGIPIAWKGHYYGRDGESLGALSIDKIDLIRSQTQGIDWSARVLESATLADLAPAAIKRARETFTLRHANRFEAAEVASWPDSTFLDRAKLTASGRITTSTMLLLGREESAHLLTPHPAQLTWKLVGPEQAYQHFSPPFLLSTTWLYQKIRNIQLRILPEDELLAVEIAKYDQKIVLEALHNCIAHQDYLRNGRIVVTEHPDRLVFENEGSFTDGAPEDFLTGERTPRRYRNPFLAQAMVELGMIDSMGYGIHQMYRGQAARYLPLPDYDLSDGNTVRLTIHGAIVDPAYTRLLIQKTDLDLLDVFALDRIQKHLRIDDGMVRHLRKAGLIEGRKPNFHVSSTVAMAANAKADYIRTRALDDEFAKKLILDYLEKFQPSTRQEIDSFLMDKLGDVLGDEQKANKISNLLTKLRRSGKIINRGSRKAPQWKIAE
ncbi:MAG: RNA-binding domain-containing protein [Verrucomicrobiota bacterium JB025]|nr:putative DNA binding domain-containing protein [Verrucomicrobiota bacterium JB025]